MSVEEVKSARGKPLFRVDDYVYMVDGTRDMKLYCRCIRARTEHCTGRVTIVKVCCF